MAVNPQAKECGCGERAKKHGMQSNPGRSALSRKLCVRPIPILHRGQTKLVAKLGRFVNVAAGEVLRADACDYADETDDSN